MPRNLSCPVLIGRDAELGLLDAALGRAASGEPTTVLLAGEAGVGKTRLLKEFRHRAETARAHIMLGGCIDLVDVALPYGPFVEALRGLARRLPPGRLAALAGAGRADLARLLPELDPDGASVADTLGAADSAQLRLFEHVLGLLGRLSEQAPLVLVLEDLHWSDRSTCRLLAFLAHSLTSERVLIVASYRSDELSRSHPLRPLLAELGRSGQVERIDVGPLDRPAFAELLTGLLCATPDTELFERIYERSEGNPFFAEELVAASLAGDPREVPATLREVLLARIEALPAETQAVLRIAAAAGREVDHELLAAVSDLPPASLLTALRVAVSEQVLRAQPDSLAYRFSHALLHEAVHDDLLPGERIALHARLARVLEQRPELAGRAQAAGALAWHWFAAQDQPRALVAALEAAAVADTSFAYAEAQRHLERAQELWAVVPDAAERTGLDLAGVLKRAASVANRAGDHQRASVLAEQALRLIDPATDPARAGLLSMLLGSARRHAGREGADEAYQEAVRLVPADPPSAARARVLGAYGGLLMVKPRYAEAERVCEEAVAVARAAGPEAWEEELDALSTLALVRSHLGDVDGGRKGFAEVRRLAEERGHVVQLIRLAANQSDLTFQQGRLEEAVEIAMEGVELAGRYGLRRGKGAFVVNNAAEFLLGLGRWDEVESLARQAVAWDSSNISRLATRLLLADLGLGRGDLEAARQALRDAGRHRAAVEQLQFQVWTAAVEGELARQESRFDDARAAVRPAVEALEDVDGVRHAGGRVFAVAIGAEADRPDPGPDRAFAVWVRDRLSAQMSAPEGVSPSFRAYALLADAEWCRLTGDDAPRWWQEAAAAFDALSMPYPAAYARMRQGAAALTAGDRDADGRAAAATALRAAHAGAQRLGARALLADIDRVARRSRVALVPEGPEASPLGLTPREAEVLRLLAEGRTNRQIGDALFITDKTASVHVSNILGKLGVASRGEAAAVAHRLGLAQDEGSALASHP